MELDKIILQQIKSNKLQGLNYDLLISQLQVVTNKPYAEIKVVVDLELANWEVDSAVYCPLVFTVDGTEYKIVEFY